VATKRARGQCCNPQGRMGSPVPQHSGRRDPAFQGPASPTSGFCATEKSFARDQMEKLSQVRQIYFVRLTALGLIFVVFVSKARILGKQFNCPLTHCLWHILPQNNEWLKPIIKYSAAKNYCMDILSRNGLEWN